MSSSGSPTSSVPSSSNNIHGASYLYPKERTRQQVSRTQTETQKQLSKGKNATQQTKNNFFSSRIGKVKNLFTGKSNNPRTVNLNTATEEQAINLFKEFGIEISRTGKALSISADADPGVYNRVLHADQGEKANKFTFRSASRKSGHKYTQEGQDADSAGHAIQGVSVLWEKVAGTRPLNIKEKSHITLRELRDAMQDSLDNSARTHHQSQTSRRSSQKSSQPSTRNKPIQQSGQRYVTGLNSGNFLEIDPYNQGYSTSSANNDSQRHRSKSLNDPTPEQNRQNIGVWRNKSDYSCPQPQNSGRVSERTGPFIKGFQEHPSSQTGGSGRTVKKNEDGKTYSNNNDYSYSQRDRKRGEYFA